MEWKKIVVLKWLLNDDLIRIEAIELNYLQNAPCRFFQGFCYNYSTNEELNNTCPLHRNSCTHTSLEPTIIWVNTLIQTSSTIIVALFTFMCCIWNVGTNDKNKSNFFPIEHHICICIKKILVTMNKKSKIK